MSQGPSCLFIIIRRHLHVLGPDYAAISVLTDPSPLLLHSRLRLLRHRLCHLIRLLHHLPGASPPAQITCELYESSYNAGVCYVGISLSVKITPLGTPGVCFVTECNSRTGCTGAGGTRTAPTAILLPPNFPRSEATVPLGSTCTNFQPGVVPRHLPAWPNCNCFDFFESDDDSCTSYAESACRAACYPTLPTRLSAPRVAECPPAGPSPHLCPPQSAAALVGVVPCGFVVYSAMAR